MDAKKILHAALFTPGLNSRWGLPLILQGEPGTAKTAHVTQAARRSGLRCETVILSIREPADIGGMPIVVDGDLKFAPPLWLRRLNEAGRGVAFFDELNHGAPAVQGAVQRGVNEGVFGDTAALGTVRFLAAQNDIGDGGVWDLTASMANRWGHLAWPAIDGAAWADYLLGPGGNGDSGVAEFDAAREEARVLKAWDTPFAKARGVVVGFAKARPDLLLKKPAAGSPKLGKAWPSPRSWEQAARALAGAEIHGLSEIDSHELLAAFVGAGAASEFVTYLVAADLPDPEAVVDEKVKWKPTVERLDRTVAVLSSCQAIVIGTKDKAKQKARAEVLWQILNVAVDQDQTDAATPVATALVAAGLYTPGSKAFGRGKAHDILRAAGIIAGSSL